jgi:hypothetical protein
MGSQIPPRLLRLRYEGTCVVCGTALQRRAEAWWYADKKEIVCTSCRLSDVDAASESENAALAEVEVAESPPLTALGQAGASARREADRRKEGREEQTLKKHPRVGKLILRVTDEPQATRAWGKGAGGEEALGARLSALASERLVVLHDRRVPGSRANIDHLASRPVGCSLSTRSTTAANSRSATSATSFAPTSAFMLGDGTAPGSSTGRRPSGGCSRCAAAGGFRRGACTAGVVLHRRRMGSVRVTVQARQRARHAPEVPVRVAWEERRN